jgi:SAM-dependent methyltransferase
VGQLGLARDTSCRFDEFVQILAHKVFSCYGFQIGACAGQGVVEAIAGSDIDRAVFEIRPNMSQVALGVSAILSHAKFYDAVQWLMGAKRGRSIVSSRYIKAKIGDCVLDIGCGTADIRRYLSVVEYFGIDPNPRYIRAAKYRFRDAQGCTFLCGTFDEAILARLPKFDIVLASAVLHHLTDDEAVRLANLAKAALKVDGRLVTLDPCYVEGQSPIAKFLIDRDRGEHVRDAAGYRSLMSSVFASVKTDVRHDLARFPYTHIAMECTLK